MNGAEQIIRADRKKPRRLNSALYLLPDKKRHEKATTLEESKINR